MAKSKKEIEKIILEQTNFVPRNEKGQEIYISLKSKKNGKKNMKHNEIFDYTFNYILGERIRELWSIFFQKFKYSSFIGTK